MAHLSGMFLRGRTWWLRYTPTPGGKQVRVSLGTNMESVAVAAAMRIKQRAPLEDTGDFLSELEKYFAAQMEANRMSAATVSVRRCVLKVFLRDCDVRRVSDLKEAVVKRWVGVLKGKKGGRGGRVAWCRVGAFLRDSSAGFL